jgi:hypothetical protein
MKTLKVYQLKVIKERLTKLETKIDTLIYVKQNQLHSRVRESND